MDNKDQLFRFIFDELDIRGEFITLDTSWKEVQARASYPENIRNQLGEAMAAVAILSATIKFNGSLILQIQADGPLKTLVAQASHDGKLRGLAKSRQEVPTGSLSDVYGKGQMVITIMNQQGEPYQSIVPLVGATLADALEHYFVHSEQLQSRFWLFVSEEKVTGLFLQELPSDANKESPKDKKQEDWERVVMLANTSTAEEFFTLTPEDLLHRLYHEEHLRIFEPKAFEFKCGCSNQKIENSLTAMGQATLREILQDNGKIEVDCEFCNQHYEFVEADIDQLFGESAVLH